MSQTDPWIIDVKGKPNANFEITVLRQSNKHGKASYGWCGENKLYIAGSGGPCHDKVCEPVFNALVHVAKCLAKFLNEGGQLEGASQLTLTDATD